MNFETPSFAEQAMETLVIHSKNSPNLIVAGDWNKILMDKYCKRPKDVFLMFKSDADVEWNIIPMDDVNVDEFNKEISVPAVHSNYILKFKIFGFGEIGPVLSKNKSLNSTFEVKSFKAIILILIK